MRNYKLKISTQRDFMGIAREHDKHEELINNGYLYDEMSNRYHKRVNISLYDSINIEIWTNMELLRFYYNCKRITPTELEEKTGKDYKLVMNKLSSHIKDLKELEII